MRAAEASTPQRDVTCNLLEYVLHAPPVVRARAINPQRPRALESRNLAAGSNGATQLDPHFAAKLASHPRSGQLTEVTAGQLLVAATAILLGHQHLHHRTHQLRSGCAENNHRKKRQGRLRPELQDESFRNGRNVHGLD
jgi:hypothetical protein